MRPFPVPVPPPPLPCDTTTVANTIKASITLIFLLVLPFFLPIYPHPSSLLPNIANVTNLRVKDLFSRETTYWSTVNSTVATCLRNSKPLTTYLQTYFLPFFWPILLWLTLYVSPRTPNRSQDPPINPPFTRRQRHKFSKLLSSYHTPTSPFAPHDSTASSLQTLSNHMSKGSSIQQRSKPSQSRGQVSSCDCRAFPFRPPFQASSHQQPPFATIEAVSHSV